MTKVSLLAVGWIVTESVRSRFVRSSSSSSSDSDGDCGLCYFFLNSPSNDGKRPFAVLRITRVVGE